MALFKSFIAEGKEFVWNYVRLCSVPKLLIHLIEMVRKIQVLLTIYD